MRLKDKVALVTGGSRGIGREVCLAYGAEGAKVAVNYYPGNDAEAEQVAAGIRAAGGQAMTVSCDVSSEEQVSRMIRRIGEEWGGVDILVNNAGIYPRKTWYEITSDEWDRVMNVNLKACFFTCRAVFPHMRRQRYGKIINVSSVTFLRGQKHFLHYVASKGGVVGFTRALSREVGEHGITVNAVSPGAIQTEQEMLDFPDPKTQDEFLAYFSREQGIPRRGMPRDLAGTFVFLASPESDFVTGQLLNVDGGWVTH